MIGLSFMVEYGGDSLDKTGGPQADFIQEVMSQLQVQVDELALAVHAWLTEGENGNQLAGESMSATEPVLIERLKRFRNTLVLLEKSATVQVVEELLTLHGAHERGEVQSARDLRGVLSLAAEQLCQHVARLQAEPGLDNALPLLALMNDSRACRGETLLSDALVLVAGIELPQPAGTVVRQSGQAESATGAWQQQRQDWIEHATAVLPELQARLGDYLQDASDERQRFGALQRLADDIDSLADFCESREFLEHLQPLFQAAALLARAIAEGEMADGPAVRSLFTQLLDSMQRCVLAADPVDLLPGDLLRNYLYHVAQIEWDSPVAVSLRRRFRLDRIRQAARAGQDAPTPTIGVGYHLSRAIRSTLTLETQPLRRWLEVSDPAGLEPMPGVVRLRVRLGQLEPVLVLMGVTDALHCLHSIRDTLSRIEDHDARNDRDGGPSAAGESPSLHTGATDIHGIRGDSANDATQPVREWHVKLAESLILLDSLLEQYARNSVRRSSTRVSSSGSPSEAVFVNMAIDTCLREARAGLQLVTDELEDILPNRMLSPESCEQLGDQLHQIDRALQILPLPELTPLLQGLTAVLTSLQMGGADAGSLARQQSAVHEQISTLLMSIDHYLGCVLQPHAAAGGLLLEAEKALQQAARLTGGVAIGDALASPPDPHTERHVFQLLPVWDRLGDALSLYRRAPGDQALAAIAQVLQELADICSRSAFPSMLLLANAVRGWFEHQQAFADTLDGNRLSLLEEVHGMIPPLIDRWLGSADGRDDGHEGSTSGDESDHPELAQLLERLEASKADFFDMHDTGGLTLTVDDDLLGSSELESPSELDNTLEHVFHHEFHGHLAQLHESVRRAQQRQAAQTYRLPDEQMLRALHAMAGSAQTVEASGLTDIVQPLQRVSLARQREGTVFDAEETDYIGELLVLLSARLQGLSSGEAVAPEIERISLKLPEFVARILSDGSAAASESESSDTVPSLMDVFGEEAQDLLQRLRRTLQSQPGVESDAGQEALAVLHTLKGSARMAGRSEIAEVAHQLEQRIQSREANSQSVPVILKAGVTTLTGLIQQASAQASVAASEMFQHSKPSETVPAAHPAVEDDAFSGLLDLATDVSVNQARLNDELGRLRDICQDIETTSARWRNALQPGQSQSAHVMVEIQADLDAAQLSLRQILHRAEREQQQSSRAASVLQQSLIRQRLVRIDACHDRLVQTLTDAMEHADCRAAIVIRGGDVTLERTLFRKLLAPLEHLVRNCVVHGIESEKERQAAGKAEIGCVELTASIDGTDLVVELRDDGRGIDREELNDLLQQRGEARVHTHEELQAVLFRSGFSRIDSPTPVGGHGLGLAAVDAVLRSLGGRVQLASQKGKGTRIGLRVPQRIVVSQVVLVEDEGLLYALPVAQVVSVRTPGAQSVQPSGYQPLRLARALAGSPAAPDRKPVAECSAALVSVNDRQLALEVDRVIGYRELVTQALGPQLARLGCYSGGSVMSDGRQVLIVNLVGLLESGLVERARQPSAASDVSGSQAGAGMAAGTFADIATSPAHQPAMPVALVIDDSLTMRVATEGLLQQCGIAVRQSRDGLEALESLLESLPQLIILDLEMPRLDGAGFLRRLYQRHGNSSPPVIVISSREESEARRLTDGFPVAAFLSKPCNRSELQGAIQAAGLRLPDLTIA